MKSLSDIKIFNKVKNKAKKLMNHEKFEGHTNSIYLIKLSKDEKTLYSADEDHKII